MFVGVNALIIVILDTILTQGDSPEIQFVVFIHFRHPLGFS